MIDFTQAIYAQAAKERLRFFDQAMRRFFLVGFVLGAATTAAGFIVFATIF